MKGDRMPKRATIGSVVRKTLSDITNLEQPKFIDLVEKDNSSHFPEDSNSIRHLLKENATLVKLIEERNKIIELSGNELQNLRMTIQKLLLQNRSLAQSNSQLLAELNSGRDKLKAIQHELLCKDALLKVKKSAMEVKADTCCQISGAHEVEMLPGNCARIAENSSKPNNCGTRNSGRSKSMGPSTANRQVEQEKVENKRRCLRRQSARFKSEEQEPTENLFEIEDAKFPVAKLPENPIQEDGLVLSGSSVTEEETSDQRSEERVLHRSSMGRPMRRAVEKVQSYKEKPLNVKMRRE